MNHGVNKRLPTVNRRTLKTVLLLPLALGLALLVLLSIVGCGHRKDRSTALRLVSWGSESEQRDLRDLIALFERRHPDIRVNLEIVPWARILDKLMVSTAGGRTPDVARVSSEWSAALAAKGLLEPLDRYVAHDNYDLDDFYPQTIDGWSKYKGVLYSIPTDFDVYAMYYNKNMFDQCGQAYPDWSWDWHDYIQAARRLTRDLDGDGRTDQWGTWVDRFWLSYVYANGGTILDRNMRRCTLDQPSAYGGIAFMGSLANEQGVAPKREETAQLGSTTLFTTGKLGMFISGSWVAETDFKYNIKDFDYDVAPLPKGPAARATWIGGSGFAVLSRSDHKDAAWELVKWMTGKHYQEVRAIRSQIIPSRKSVAGSGAFLKLDKPPRHRKVFLDMIPYGRPTPYVACMPEIEELVKNELDRVILGEESAEVACKRVTPLIDQLLRQDQ